MKMTRLDLPQTAAPATPPGGWTRLHIAADGHPHVVASTGANLDALPFPAPAFVRKTADSSTTSNALADLPELSFTLEAGGQYVFQFTGSVSSSQTGSAAYFAVNGPTIGANGLLYHGWTPASPTTKRLDSDTAWDQAEGPGASAATGVRYGWRMWGYVHVSAAGTLAMRYRSDTAGAVTTVYAGAHGLLLRVA